MQLFECVAQGLVLVGFHRIQPGENLRLDFLEAGQRLDCRIVRQRDRVAHLRGLEFLDPGDDETHFSGEQFTAFLRFRGEHAYLLAQIIRLVGHQQDPVLGAQRPIHHAHQHRHADVVVEPGVDDQCLERSIGIAPRSRDARYGRLEDVLDTFAGLGAGSHRIVGHDADDVLDFRNDTLRIRRGQIDLVEYRHDLDALLDGGITIGNGLGFHALGGVHDQQRAFAGRQRSAYFIGKIDVPRRIDQVQLVNLAVPCLVVQRSGLRLDGNAAFALEVHGIEHLFFHLAIGKTSAKLDETVRKSGLAVIYMGNDRKIADMLHQKKGHERALSRGFQSGKL